MILITNARGPQRASIGWLISTSRRVVLALTDLRILCVKTTASGRQIESISEVRWGVVEAASVSRISNRLHLRYRDGRAEVFTIARSNDATLARAALPGLLQPMAKETGGRRALCPQCVQPVPKGLYRCLSCRAAFRNPKSAVRFALWWPGGGYFFLHRYPAALLAVLVEVLLLALIPAIWRFHELDLLKTPWMAIGGVALVWMVWRLVGAVHVRTVARELLIDREPGKRVAQTPHRLLASAVREVGQAGVEAAVASSAATAAALTATARSGQ